MAVKAAEIQTIEGHKTLVVEDDRGFPKSLPDLLGQMVTFGFAFSDDFTLRGARPSCEALRVHRFRRFREGRWFSRQPIRVYGAQDSFRVIPAGVLNLNLTMCEDCGAVCVRDVSPEDWAGARPARFMDSRTGQTRVAPAIGQRNVVLAWYSGKRRAGREYHRL